MTEMRSEVGLIGGTVDDLLQGDGDDILLGGPCGNLRLRVAGRDSIRGGASDDLIDADADADADLVEDSLLGVAISGANAEPLFLVYDGSYCVEHTGNVIDAGAGNDYVGAGAAAAAAADTVCGDGSEQLAALIVANDLLFRSSSAQTGSSLRAGLSEVRQTQIALWGDRRQPSGKGNFGDQVQQIPSPATEFKNRFIVRLEVPRAERGHHLA